MLHTHVELTAEVLPCLTDKEFLVQVAIRAPLLLLELVNVLLKGDLVISRAYGNYSLIVDSEELQKLWEPNVFPRRHRI